MKWTPALALGIVLAAALAARLAWLHDAPNVNEPDEFLHLNMAENFARGHLVPRYDYSPYRDDFLFVPPMPLYMAGLVFRLFGTSLLTFRAMNVVFGLAGVVAFHALSGLYLGGAPRAVAVALFALSPLALYESTTAMLGAPAVFFLIVSLWAYVLFVREGRRGDLVVFAVSWGATAACKQFGLLLGGVVVVHWCWRRVAEGAPSLKALAVAVGVALGTFVVLAPWVLWRPRDSVHFYVYQTVVVQVLAFVRGQRVGGDLLGLPYPGLMGAHALVGLLGLGVFLATWRRRGDVLGLYGVLLALPICVVREVRYLGVALPALCLFVGHLLAVVEELAARRARLARLANRALMVLLVGSLALPAVRPWRVPSGIGPACRYVAERTEPGERVASNYWQPVIERLTGRRVPCDWLDGEARRLIREGAVTTVIVDRSPYTLRRLHTPERARVAAWVRRRLPLERTFGRGTGAPTEVYRAAPREASEPSSPAR